MSIKPIIKWTAEKRNVNDLKQLINNPRKWSIDNKHALEESLSKFSMATAITINLDNTIIGGNFRHNIISGMNDDSNEVIVLVPNRLLDHDEVDELSIRLNKNGGEWDFDKLSLFTKSNLLDWGFNNDELDFFKEKDTIGDNNLPDNVKDHITVYGDVWEMNEHRLKCGDSTNEIDVKSLMNDKKFKTLFTSPPYNMAAGLYNDYKDNLSNDDFVKFNFNVLMLYKKYILFNGFVFWNMSYNKNSGPSYIEVFYEFVKNSGLRFLEDITWDKGHGLPIQDKLTRQYEHILVLNENRSDVHDIDHIGVFGNSDLAFIKSGKKGITNYWRIDSNGSQSDDFKASFPLDLPLNAIKLTTVEGDIIVDCFCGQGTTIIAAEKSKRVCYTMELSPEYCDLTIIRYIKFCIANGKEISLKRNGSDVDIKNFNNEKETK